MSDLDRVDEGIAKELGVGKRNGLLRVGDADVGQAFDPKDELPIRLRPVRLPALVVAPASESRVLGANKRELRLVVLEGDGSLSREEPGSPAGRSALL